jgi:hypothetical protein
MGGRVRCTKRANHPPLIAGTGALHTLTTVAVGKSYPPDFQKYTNPVCTSETDNGYLTTLAHRNPVTAVPESVNADIEQIKIMQVFIKSLMQENISNRRRLEFLEGFTLDRSTDLEARGVTLAEQCDVFNEQLMLLARHHDDLLDIMQQFSITFFEHARILEDLKEWRQSQQLAERTSKEPGHSTIFHQEAPQSTHNPDTRRESISSLSISDATVERKPVRLRIRMSKPGPDPGHSTTLDQEAPRSTYNTETRWESISPLSISDATAERQPVRLRINMRKSGPPALKTGLLTPPATDDEIDPASMQLIKMTRAEKPDDTRQNRRMSAKALEEAATSGKQHERKRNSGSSDEALAAKRPRVRPFDL